MTQSMRQLPGATVVPLLFGQTDVAASQSAEALQAPLCEAAAAVTGLTMPVAGEILHMTIDTSVAGTDGLATASATINGTADADTAVSLADAAVSNRLAVARGAAPFAAGDVLGVKLTTDGDWDATTADMLVTVYVGLWL